MLDRSPNPNPIFSCSSTTKSGRKSTKKKRKDYVEDYSDSEEEESESESEEEEVYYQPKKKALPKEQFPPVADMVVESIKALKDNPK